jgi:LysM repeat protein
MSQNKTHRVRSGETLTSIATLEAVNINELAELNEIFDINRIRNGQLLKIP